MRKQFTELRELLLSIDSKHFTWNDARADVLNQLHDLQSKAEDLPISDVAGRSDQFFAFTDWYFKKDKEIAEALRPEFEYWLKNKGK